MLRGITPEHDTVGELYHVRLVPHAIPFQTTIPPHKNTKRTVTLRAIRRAFLNGCTSRVTEYKTLIRTALRSHIRIKFMCERKEEYLPYNTRKCKGVHPEGNDRRIVRYHRMISEGITQPNTTYGLSCVPSTKSGMRKKIVKLQLPMHPPTKIAVSKRDTKV